MYLIATYTGPVSGLTKYLGSEVCKMTVEEACEKAMSMAREAVPQIKDAQDKLKGGGQVEILSNNQAK